jgi:hypothetical protein
MSVDKSGGWDTITDGWGKRCVLPALKQKPKSSREEILKKWDAFPQPPSGMLAQAAVDPEAENKFLAERKTAAKAELASRKAARDAIKLEAIAAAKAIRAAKREQLVLAAKDHVRLRREIRIGKCPICRRRYGYVPTELEKTQSTTAEIITRECDRHGEPVKVP